VTRFSVTLVPERPPDARPWSGLVDAANRFDALRTALERFRAEPRGSGAPCTGTVRPAAPPSDPAQRA